MRSLVSILLPLLATALRLFPVAALLPVVSEASNASPRQMIHAAKAGNEAEMRELLAKGGDVNVKDELENTPLHWASYHGHAFVIEMLIEKGADVNAINKLDSTPLHEASKWGNTAVIIALIAKGADVKAKDIREWMPRDVAKHHRNNAAIEVLDSGLVNRNFRANSSADPLNKSEETGAK